MIAEPDVTLRRWLLLFFAAGAAATLLGGTVHGFFTEATSPDGALLWAWTLIAVGVSALAAGRSTRTGTWPSPSS